MTDLPALKERQQQTWAAGDFSVCASASVLVSEWLCEAVELHAGQKVLDVATGSGNTALAAARRWCEVTGIDYVPALLDRGRERAAVERLPVTFQVGDTEQIPFPEASFDVVLSTFGAMFAPDQEQAAREIMRVCRPGGKIGLANWTPEGIVGAYSRALAQHVPPPPGIKPPILWGTEERLRELFGGDVISLQVTRCSVSVCFRSAQHWLELMGTYFGPVKKAFEALDAVGQTNLTRDLLDILYRFNRSGDETLVLPAEYLEVVATKR